MRQSEENPIEYKFDLNIHAEAEQIGEGVSFHVFKTLINCYKDQIVQKGRRLWDKLL